MALKKKNVFQGFMPDDYVPSGDQQIVKYLLGKGNNLHEVESPTGSIFLVTMPKKFRQTVWLKKGNCIVIDPITEGKKVQGEIICVVPSKSVVEMIKSGEWFPKLEDFPENTTTCNGAGDGSTKISLEERRKNFLVQFYADAGGKNSKDEDESMMPPSESEEEDSSLSDDEDEASDHEESSSTNNTCKGDVAVLIGNHSNQNQNPITYSAPELDNDEDEGYKSRVQFLASGIVTVTNVVNDISSLNLQNGLQSLDFETEDSSLESQQQSQVHQNDNNSTSVHRQANTIRIQVNYPPESAPHDVTDSNISNDNNQN